MIIDMLIGPVILDDPMTGQNYLYVIVLQCELSEQLENVSWLHILLSTLSMTEPLLIIPDL